jgi:putative SOS response-associated peptidase YedK
MPVILPQDAEDRWLERPGTSLLRPYPMSDLEAFPVSRRVNRADVEEAGLVERLAGESS